MSTLVQISTQYYENYGSEQNPHWKAKGGQIFTIRADVYDLMYDEEYVVKAVKMLLAEECNSHCRYEYIDHEIIFSEPVELKGFKDKLEQVLNESKSKSKDIPTDEEWRNEEMQWEYMNGEYPDEY